MSGATVPVPKPGEPPVTDPTVTPPAPTPDPAKPYAVFPDADAFKKRVAQEARQILKEYGISDPEELKKLIEERAAVAKAAEEARRQQMSELQRAQDDAAKAAREKAEAEAARDRAVREAQVARACAETGAKNLGYAQWSVEAKLATLPAGTSMDEAAIKAHLIELAKDDTGKAALGMVVTPPTPALGAPPKTVPANTTVPGRDLPPSPNPGATPPKDVMSMSTQEFQDHLAKTHGVSGVG